MFVLVTVVAACQSIFFSEVNNSAATDQLFHQADSTPSLASVAVLHLTPCVRSRYHSERGFPRIQGLISSYHYHFLQTFQVLQLPPPPELPLRSGTMTAVQSRQGTDNQSHRDTWQHTHTEASVNVNHEQEIPSEFSVATFPHPETARGPV